MGKVTFEVDDEGNIIIKVDGIKGEGCIELTKDLEKRLGKVLDKKKTEEYEEEEEVSVQRRVEIDG